MNILNRTRFYLIGAIEADPNEYGASWRNYLKESLKETGILFFDPCDKPFVKDVEETSEAQDLFKKLKDEERYDELADYMRKIRIYDLSMVDKADGIIFYLDKDVFTCGSYEEFFWSVRLKRPTFVVCKQGKKNLPSWLFGCIPHKYFYNSLDEVISVLKKINIGEIEVDSERWRLLKPEYR